MFRKCYPNFRNSKRRKKKMDINEYLKGNDLKVGTDVD